ncbi:MAG: universal stress protein [Gammaproteobacteria bacterium]|nr:universal stress protein [Gammaproteobacteria bacterium]
MYQNILVPVDGSDTADRALREAIQLARNLSSRIRIMHVVNSTPWITQGAPGVIEELVTQLRSTGESIIHEAKTAVRQAGIEVDHRLIEAIGERAGEIIVGEANDWPAHLIVLGTHGRRGLRRLLVGGDAEYIVRHSPVPVLLIRGS